MCACACACACYILYLQASYIVLATVAGGLYFQEFAAMKCCCMVHRRPLSAPRVWLLRLVGVMLLKVRLWAARHSQRERPRNWAPSHCFGYTRASRLQNYSRRSRSRCL